MKSKLFFTPLLILFCCVFSCQDKEQGYTVQGILNGEVEQGRVFLYEAGGERVALDSAVIEENRFILKGAVALPGLYELVIDLNEAGTEDKDYYDKTLRSLFYLENSLITFTADVATMPSWYPNPKRTGTPVIEGSKTEQLHQEYRTRLKGVQEERIKAHEKYSKEYIIPRMQGMEVSQRGIEIVKEMNALSDRDAELTFDFIKNNAESIVSIDLMSEYLTSPRALTLSELNDFLSWIEKPWEGTEQLAGIKNQIDKRRKVAPGQDPFDGSFLTVDNHSVSISSLIEEGKYTLLDFWASWCAPCRAEIPHLKAVQKKYPEFNIISISVDDEDAKWREVLAEEAMPWLQLRSKDGFNGIVKTEYNVQRVPTCIVVDKEGKYYKTNMRGAYLDEFLFETY